MDASASDAEKNGVIGGRPLWMRALAIKAVVVFLVDVFAKV
jgi:hypothetical protein